MNYILKKLDQEIEIKKVISDDKFELGQLLRVKIELYLLLILGYLWNKNFKKLPNEETRQNIVSRIIRPSLGTIVDISKLLDLDKDVFCDKKLLPSFFDYTTLRNETLGHGFMFGDKLSEYVNELEKIILVIEKSKISIISLSWDLVYISGEDSVNYKGVSFKSDGGTIKPCLIPKHFSSLQRGALYCTVDFTNIFRISPFVQSFGNDEFYLYKCVEEKLTGRVCLNCISRTYIKQSTWMDFADFWEVNDGIKRISGNGTIINIFKNNYSNYIKIGSTKKKIENFLINKSSVAATIWGHGGVGKTATIQRVCQDFSASDERKFDYMLFLSAKDRYYNYFNAEIENIEDRIDNYENLVETINEIIFDDKVFNEDRIVNSESKILIIIDDYETFSKEDQKKIEEFIDRLNINHHKVIITTRISNLKIGSEIQTNELDEEETKKFIIELIKSHFPTVDVKTKEIELNAGNNVNSIYQITSGRPLFIYQFVNYWMRSGSIGDSMIKDIKNQKNAINFLYGRIYNSLDKVGKDIFDAISVLVNESDLSHLVDKLKYILNKEKDTEEFNNGLEELQDLLIIQVEDNFFTVLSKEILKIMDESFNKRGDTFIRFVKDRLNQVGRSKELDTDIALLKTADSYRTSRTETEVESIYRQILNRSTNKKEIQLRALLNLSDYWFNYRGNKDKAIKVLEEYEIKFSDQPLFVKMFSNYLWAKGFRTRANNILTLYFESKPSVEKEINIELLGLIVIYKSITVIEERENLKSKKKFEQISNEEYLPKYREQKQQFLDVYNFYGLKLLDIAKKSHIEGLKPGTRQNIATGLYQLVDVCCRINKKNEALDICNYSINYLPDNFNRQFTNSKRRISN